jgi:hypothetical protein
LQFGVRLLGIYGLEVEDFLDCSADLERFFQDFESLVFYPVVVQIIV